MERSSATALLASLVLVTSATVVPALGGTPAAARDSPGDRPAGLAVADGGGTGPATGVGSVAAPSPTENTTARLVLPYYRIEQARFESVTVGMGSTLQSTATAVELRTERLSVRRQFEAANSTADRRSTIDRALIELETRSEALEARERAAIREFSNGNITGQTLVQRLARIDAAARDVRSSLNVVRDLTDRIQVTVFDSRIRDIEGRVEPLLGPVRSRVARTLAGEASPTRVYVVGSDRGVVLSTLVDGRYVREGTRWANRNASAPSELDFGEIGARVERLYPWVTGQDGVTAIRWRGRGSWRFRASHPQGQLTSYVDAATGNVYRETQTLSVDSMPTTTAVDRSGNGLRVTLLRTYAGGPLRVVVEDAATDAVVDASVTVQGHDLGRTGTDGEVVTLEPRAPYTVNVTNGDATLYISVERPFGESEG